MLKYIKYVLPMLSGFVFPVTVWADLTIFDVRKNLPMSDTDPVYRDFYIDGGSESGLSVGMVLTVQRRMPLYDSYQNRSVGDLMLKVSKIKIIHVQRGLSVARLQSEFTREGSPLLEDPYIMVGDRIDLSSASSDKKADNGGGESAPTAAAEPTPPPTRTAAQIVVNSVELSSQAPVSKAASAPMPQKIDAPILQ